MKEMSQHLLGVVTQSLQGGSPAHSPMFNPAIECTETLSELYIYASYKSDDDATMSYMEHALYRFHNFKDVFLLGWAGKQAMAKANALRMELVKKRNVDEEINAETWTPSRERHYMKTWWDNISQKIDVSKELDADCNFPNTHLISPWVNSIRWYGSLQQYSAKRHE
jgi:hypothetical protein